MNMIDVIRRRMLMGGRKVSYDAEIEYLESTGVQFIDTGIIPDADTGIRVCLSTSSSNDSYAVGLRNNTGDTRWVIGSIGNSYPWSGCWYYGYGKDTIFNGSNFTVRSVVSMNFLGNMYATVEDQNVGRYSLSTLSFAPSYDIRLFGSKGVAAAYTKWSGKIYFVQVSQGSNIVMDMIPVRVGQTGYMYDKVSGRLFGNNGSGNFILGNDK